MVCGTLIVMGYNMCASILRGLGDGRTPLAAMIIAAIVNIVLDCLFVFVFKWGVMGAAAASLLAQLISLIFCIIAISKIDCICLDKSSWNFDRERIKKCFSLVCLLVCSL